MPFIENIRSDIREAKKLRMPGWAVVCIIVVSFVCAQLFERIGKLSLVLPILNCVGILGFIIVFKKRLWRYSWFWGTMIVVAALHIPLIFCVPWSAKWFPALAIAAIDSVDFCLILCILTIVEKWCAKENTTRGRITS